jgi:transposase-like protein
LRYKLGFREVAELLLHRWYDVTHETIRLWQFRFAPPVSTLPWMRKLAGCHPTVT